MKGVFFRCLHCSSRLTFLSTGHYWYLGLDTVAHRMFAGNSARLIASKVIVDSLVLGPLYVVRLPVFASFLFDNLVLTGSL